MAGDRVRRSQMQDIWLHIRYITVSDGLFVSSDFTKYNETDLPAGFSCINIDTLQSGAVSCAILCSTHDDSYSEAFTHNDSHCICCGTDWLSQGIPEGPLSGFYFNNKPHTGKYNAIQEKVFEHLDAARNCLFLRFSKMSPVFLMLERHPACL